MILAQEDADVFYALNPELLMYVSTKRSGSPGVSTREEFMALPQEQKVALRNALYDAPRLLDEFVAEKGSTFKPDELAIIEGWRHFVRDKFLVLAHLKPHSVFLSTSEAKAYGVVSIRNELEEMLPRLPVMVDAVLLPFKGRIIYDGSIAPYRIAFGGRVKRGFQDSYQKAKAEHGIICSLPFKPRPAEDADADRLRLYLKNDSSRNRYWHEIVQLKQSSPRLEAVYHEELGKTFARSFTKRLRDAGVTNAWFATLEGMIVASGRSRKDAENNLDILPAEKRKSAYLFRVK